MTSSYIMKLFKVLPLFLFAIICSCKNKHGNELPIIDDIDSLELSFDSISTDDIDSLELSTDSIPTNPGDVFTCVSEDSKITFQSWDTGMGGTCPVYAVVCRFLTKDGKTITTNLRGEDGDPAWVSYVHAIKSNDGITYYLTKRTHKASSNDGYMWVDAFIIDHDSLKKINIFDDSIDEEDLCAFYYIADWYFKTNGEGWDWLCEYDTKSRDLYIPTTVSFEESIPVITDRYKVYHFNGKKFVYQGEHPHKGLHSSVSNYKQLVRYFRTKNYVVRVDVLNDGSLRYASWKSTHDMSQKPDLVIIGGQYDKDKDTYTFINNGHHYYVGYSEDKQLPKGGYEHHEFLMIKKNGKVVLKEERLR